MLIAFSLEDHLSKQRILELYLNVAEWGDGVFGAEAAAKKWFGHTAQNLSPSEAARLAIALPNPFTRAPNVHTEELPRRRCGSSGSTACRGSSTPRRSARRSTRSARPRPSCARTRRCRPPHHLHCFAVADAARRDTGTTTGAIASAGRSDAAGGAGDLAGSLERAQEAVDLGREPLELIEITQWPAGSIADPARAQPIEQRPALRADAIGHAGDEQVRDGSAARRGPSVPALLSSTSSQAWR